MPVIGIHSSYRVVAGLRGALSCLTSFLRVLIRPGSLLEDLSMSPLRTDTRTTFLPFCRPTIGEDEIQGVVECLSSDWLTTGSKAQQFETEFARYVDSRNALAVMSGTAGEHLALLALGIGPGDEVITTSLTWASTVNIITICGATPVFVDVDPNTFNLDVNLIEEKITDRTRAIIPVHFAGLPCDVDRIATIAQQYLLVVLEDAAHAVGTFYKGKPVGSLSPVTVFSFHPIKNMTTGEGGMITTNDDELAKVIRLLRFHGITRETCQRQGKNGSLAYDILRPGLKYNMTDIQAAIGLVQLRRLKGFIQRRGALANLYRERLGEIEEIRLPPKEAQYPTRHACHLFPILLDINRMTIDRLAFIEALKEENIGTGLHFLAVHLHSYYRKTFGFQRGDLPHTEYISDRVLSLPLFPRMEESDVDDVVRAIKKVIYRFRK
jgi:dTDP-4-amino-4,6-dideoxygalactose transaminase